MFSWMYPGFDQPIFFQYGLPSALQSKMVMGPCAPRKISDRGRGGKILWFERDSGSVCAPVPVPRMPGGLQWMKEQAELNSGVKQSETTQVGDLYNKIGEPAFRKLSVIFYDKVYSDEEWFKDIFKGKDKESAIQNQCEFFMQRMGGPSLYSDRKGNQTLISRHKGWRVDKPAAERWLSLMTQSLEDIGDDIDPESKEVMLKFFKHTAYLLVAAKEVMHSNKPESEKTDAVKPGGKDIILAKDPSA